MDEELVKKKIGKKELNFFVICYKIEFDCFRLMDRF